jgi:hypothetical protein
LLDPAPDSSAKLEEISQLLEREKLVGDEQSPLFRSAGSPGSDVELCFSSKEREQIRSFFERSGN